MNSILLFLEQTLHCKKEEESNQLSQLSLCQSIALLAMDSIFLFLEQTLHYKKEEQPAEPVPVVTLIAMYCILLFLEQTLHCKKEEESSQLSQLSLCWSIASLAMYSTLLSLEQTLHCKKVEQLAEPVPVTCFTRHVQHFLFLEQTLPCTWCVKAVRRHTMPKPDLKGKGILNTLIENLA
eukprot:1160483-Pelagomonas_calceolata.AAC.4